MQRHDLRRIVAKACAHTDSRRRVPLSPFLPFLPLLFAFVSDRIPECLMEFLETNQRIPPETLRLFLYLMVYMLLIALENIFINMLELFLFLMKKNSLKTMQTTIENYKNLYSLCIK